MADAPIPAQAAPPQSNFQGMTKMFPLLHKLCALTAGQVVVAVSQAEDSREDRPTIEVLIGPRSTGEDGKQALQPVLSLRGTPGQVEAALPGSLQQYVDMLSEGKDLELASKEILEQYLVEKRNGVAGALAKTKASGGAAKPARSASAKPAAAVGAATPHDDGDDEGDGEAGEGPETPAPAQAVSERAQPAACAVASASALPMTIPPRTTPSDAAPALDLFGTN